MDNGSRGTGALAPYVPRLAAEWERRWPGERWRALDATCCFVDISGFTALSERLARRGRIGAEELTEVLNHVFGRMLDIAYAKGGSLLKFGGDALLLLFSDDDHARLAAEAAVAMRAALREARTLPTSVGRLNLRMSTGIHSGTFHYFRVGESHRELIVAGPAASTTTRMEAAADAGEIVVSEATAARLPARACGAPKGDGRLLRGRKVVDGGPGPRPLLGDDLRAAELAVPTVLRRHLRHAAGESEHRVASVGFLKFRGTDDLLEERGPDETASALHEIVSAVQEIVDPGGVTFLASDIDDNGGKIILTAGVPVAQEDDEGRLLRAARSIVDRPLPLPVRIGVNRGHVFAGEIGTEFRRTFTVMGDTVNLAARLMAAAPGGAVYATREILDRARTQFETEPLEPFRVKGKSQPVQAYAVHDAIGDRTSRSGALPFLGREREIRVLQRSEEDARQDRGSVVVVEAERGAGKTRLLDEFRRTVRIETELFVAGEPYGAGVPYKPLREPLRRLFGIADADRERAGRETVAAVRERAPEQVELAPLLAPVLDVEIEPTAASTAIADEFVRERLADLLVAMLTTPAPLLVIAEDAHWFDDATSHLMERLVHAARERSWLVVVARRGAESGYRPDDPDTVITLTRLEDGVSSELVELATRRHPLRPQDRDRIVARSNGNPLFLEELARAALDTDVDELPDSLDAVAMREIDALPPAARRALRLASVLGSAFDRSLLADVLASEEIELDVVTLGELEQLLESGGDERLRFRHALFREAAYASLPFRTRLVLHRRAGETIERRASGDGDDDLPALLAMHFLEAHEWERAWQYARGAASLAQGAHAPGEAATNLERAITAARRIEDVPHQEIGRLHAELGAELITLGLYDRADDAYRRAASAVPGEALTRAEFADQRACIRGEFQGRLAAAIRQVRTGLALLEATPAGTPAVERVRAQLLARQADLRYRQGRLNDAARLSREAAAVAEGSGEQRAQAAALSVLDSCLVEMGRPSEATNMVRALELYEALGDHLHVAITLGNLGGVSFFDSKWDRAAEYYLRAVDASNAAGDLAGAAINNTNLGELRLGQGRLAEADSLLAPAVRTLESFGYSFAAAAATLHLGRVRGLLGRTDEAIELIRNASDVFDQTESRVTALEARARLAETSALAGRLDAAVAAFSEARDLEHGLGESALSALLDRVAVTIAIAAGDRAEARSLLAQAVETARRLDAKFDLLVLLAMAEILGEAGDGRERAELTRELGVVELAVLGPLVDPSTAPD